MGTNRSGTAANTTTKPAMLGYRVLLVDDYRSFQELLASSLGKLAQIKEIDYADSGIGAIEKAETKRYDLIFLDVMMPPGIAGYETCARLRATPAYNKTPIVIVSGLDSPFDEAKGIISGCTTYVTKPVQHEPFLTFCKNILETIG